jgi:hypothetical protein
VVFEPSYLPSDVDVLTLGADGTYTLLIEGWVYSTTAGSYQFNIQPVSDDAAPLVVGAPVTGSIAHTGQQDRYTFTLAGDTQVYFDALTADPNISWSLAGPRGTEVSGRSFADSDSLSVAGNPVLDLLAGDYTLSVDGYLDTTGAYAFQLLDVLADAVAITPGVVVNGTLDPGNETDVYQFAALAGDQFYFDSQTTTSSAYWRLLDPYGGVVFEPGYLPSDIDVLTLGVDGTYTLLIEGWVYSTTPEGYAFNIQPVSDDAAPLVVGAPVTGSIAHTGQQDQYAFTLASDTKVYFDSLSAQSGISWSLTGPRGTEVSDRAFTDSDSSGVFGSPVLDLVAGDYTLSVDGYLDTTGAYAFRLLDADAEAVAITPGTVVSGTLDPGNETDVYRFDALAGDQFYFDSQDAGSTAYWRLLDPYNRVVFGPNYMPSDVDVLTLEADGTYTLLIEGSVYSTTADSYQFNVESRGHTDPPALTGTAITIGSTVNGTIATAGQEDDYLVTLTGPGRFYFDSLSSNFNLTWSLRGPRGVEVAGLDFTSSDSVGLGGNPTLSLDVPGTYQIRVSGTGTGSYSFRVLDVDAEAIATTPGTVVNGTLDPGNETDVYQFDALAGDQFYFDSQDASSTAYWRLLDPYGGVVFEPSYLPSDVDVLTLGADGTYTLLIEGWVYSTTA